MNDGSPPHSLVSHQHYGKWAGNYDERANVSLMARVTHEIRLVLESSSGRALDLGCGTGWTVEKFWNRSVMGVDASYAMLRRRALIEKCQGRFVVASGTQLPFVDASFGALFSINVAEHVPTPLNLWREAHRVLAPGGSLMVITPAREMEMVLNAAERLHLKIPEGPHRFLDRTELGEGLQKAGFLGLSIQRILALPIGGERWLRWTVAADRRLGLFGLMLIARASKRGE